MILVSKVLLGFATAALIAGSVTVPDVAGTARTVAALLSDLAPRAQAAVMPPHCAGSCDVWGMLSHPR